MTACSPSNTCKIAVESNHRIANHMMILASQVRLRRSDFAKAPDGQARDEVLRMFDGIGAQVAAVAHLHWLLTSDASVSSGDIGAQLGRLCEAFRKGPAGDTVIEHTLERGCILPVTQILPVSQMFSEAVTNALKYGHRPGCAGMIRVGCQHETGDRITISVEDDGPGLPPKTAFGTKPNGIGIAMIEALARQVNGTIQHRSTDTGVLFRLSLASAFQSTFAQQALPGRSTASANEL